MELFFLVLIVGVPVGVMLGGSAAALWWAGSALFGWPAPLDEQVAALCVAAAVIVPLISLLSVGFIILREETRR